MKSQYRVGLAMVLTAIYALQVASLLDAGLSVVGTRLVLILFTFCAVLGLVLLMPKARGE